MHLARAFAVTVARQPNRIAVVDGDIRRTYAQWLAEAERRAAKLRRQTVVDDLELAHDLGRESNTSCPGCLICIVQPVNRD